MQYFSQKVIITIDILYYSYLKMIFLKKLFKIKRKGVDNISAVLL